jgi:hypothetical protein
MLHSLNSHLLLTDKWSTVTDKWSTVDLSNVQTMCYCRYVGTTRASRDPACGFWYPKTTGKCAPPLGTGHCNCSEPGAQRAISITQSPGDVLFDDVSFVTPLY